MTETMRSELLKLRTVRATWIIVAAAALYPLLGVLAAATAPEGQGAIPEATAVFDAIKGAGQLAAVAALLVGIMAAAGEYRHGTIVPSVLGTPRRSRFLISKIVVLAVLGVILGAAAAATATLSGVVYLAVEGTSVTVSIGELILSGLGVAVAVALYAATGVAVGSLIRNQTVAVAAALVWVTVVENILPVVLRQPDLPRWLPGRAAERLFTAAATSADQIPLLGALAVLGGVAVVASILATVVTVSSDVA